MTKSELVDKYWLEFLQDNTRPAGLNEGKLIVEATEKEFWSWFVQNKKIDEVLTVEKVTQPTEEVTTNEVAQEEEPGQTVES